MLSYYIHQSYGIVFTLKVNEPRTSRPWVIYHNRSTTGLTSYICLRSIKPQLSNERKRSDQQFSKRNIIHYSHKYCLLRFQTEAKERETFALGIFWETRFFITYVHTHSIFFATRRMSLRRHQVCRQFVAWFLRQFEAYFYRQYVALFHRKFIAVFYQNLKHWLIKICIIV